MVIFDALVREQGISAAARRLGVSKSHISKQLALLETALGAQLRLPQACQAVNSSSAITKAATYHGKAPLFS